ncbi:bifunctional diaminohydroxyphosphoribosylaminopyrimidine deaminase/5-amino-6-(5-phosphoribosylamino)uracil reductase RibD [Flavobacterium luteum]|uniref:Riboflavin biosynthesis protein RibD n=1 Tax=Flavobacterium luteum TaxID=2026654 RepID=A0A7J5AFY3_9FLAO|nr:bifunctional diaminohydroxyphosphoribosylaminopyrimidine deaminase/5-amino-6-(5-phosphoribosylamino)uracil reductase RibD [Flavobacterium luteum]KAB1156501.1 bifunctional diaminohydroxyphosphoribosylaminopyrimidine deaminase/5-amino-6-(5-phosphoribosylamino)uracil reductase RibD [Flavobacterium luteum]
MKIEEKYIKRCLEIAKKGLPAALPNPSVGAVIVYEDKIIGEGYTSAYGGAHAEVNAIQAVKDKSLLKKATIYVSLEPCSHFGKTPPCCNLIIEHKIPNIVIGTVDPNAKVAGNGIKTLIESGKNVIVGILEKECKESNKRFFTFHEKKRPYIILKWAESQDGYIAPKEKSEQKPVWITNEISRQLVHKWRSEEQAILVGTQTVVDDNPRLNVRDWVGKNPIRIVLDQNNRIPKESYIFDNQVETIIFSSTEIDFSATIACQISAILFERNIQSVLIEGGKKTLQTFIDENLWDEARVFKGNLFLENGTKAPILKSKWIERQFILDDELLIFKNYD